MPPLNLSPKQQLEWHLWSGSGCVRKWLNAGGCAAWVLESSLHASCVVTPCSPLRRLLVLRSSVAAFMLRAAELAGDAAGIVEAIRCGTAIGTAWEAAASLLLPAERSLRAAVPLAHPPPLQLTAPLALRSYEQSGVAYASVYNAVVAQGGAEGLQASLLGHGSTGGGIAWANTAQSLYACAAGNVRVILAKLGLQEEAERCAAQVQPILPMLRYAAALQAHLPPTTAPDFVTLASSCSQHLFSIAQLRESDDVKPGSGMEEASSLNMGAADDSFGDAWANVAECLRIAIDAATAAPPDLWQDSSGEASSVSRARDAAPNAFAAIFGEPSEARSTPLVVDGGPGRHALMVGRLRLSLAWTLLQSVILEGAHGTSAARGRGGTRGNDELAITGLVVGSGLSAEPLALHILVRLALLEGDAAAARVHGDMLIDVCSARSLADAAGNPAELPGALFSLVLLTCHAVASHGSWSAEAISLYSSASKKFSSPEQVGTIRIELLSHLLSETGGLGSMAARVSCLGDALPRVPPARDLLAAHPFAALLNTVPQALSLLAGRSAVVPAPFPLAPSDSPVGGLIMRLLRDHVTGRFPLHPQSAGSIMLIALLTASTDAAFVAREWVLAGRLAVLQLALLLPSSPRLLTPGSGTDVASHAVSGGKRAREPVSQPRDGLGAQSCDAVHLAQLHKTVTLCSLHTGMWPAALIHAHAALLLADSTAARFLVFRVLSQQDALGRVTRAMPGASERDGAGRGLADWPDCKLPEDVTFLACCLSPFGEDLFAQQCPGGVLPSRGPLPATNVALPHTLAAAFGGICLGFSTEPNHERVTTVLRACVDELLLATSHEAPLTSVPGLLLQEERLVVAASALQRTLTSMSPRPGQMEALLLPIDATDARGVVGGGALTPLVVVRAISAVASALANVRGSASDQHCSGAAAHSAQQVAATAATMDALSSVYWGWCAPLLVSLATSPPGGISVVVAALRAVVGEHDLVAAGAEATPHENNPTPLSWALSVCHDVAMGGGGGDDADALGGGQGERCLETALRAAELLEGFARVSLAILSPAAPSVTSRELGELRQVSQIILATLHLQLAESPRMAGAGGNAAVAPDTLQPGRGAAAVGHLQSALRYISTARMLVEAGGCSAGLSAAATACSLDAAIPRSLGSSVSSSVSGTTPVSSPAALLATLEFHAHALLAVAQLPAAAPAASIASAERFLSSLLDGYRTLKLPLTTGQWLHCAELASVPPLNLWGVVRTALLAGLVEALDASAGSAAPGRPLVIGLHADVPVAAAILRRLVFSCSTRSEVLPLLERTLDVVNASLRAFKSSPPSLLSKPAPRPGAISSDLRLLFPPDELDHSVTVAWNHGAWFFRVGDLAQAAQFMGWAVSLLPALDELLLRHAGGQPAAAASAATALGCTSFRPSMCRQLDHTLALLRKTNRATQTAVAEKLAAQVTAIALLAPLVAAAGIDAAVLRADVDVRLASAGCASSCDDAAADSAAYCGSAMSDEASEIVAASTGTDLLLGAAMVE